MRRLINQYTLISLIIFLTLCWGYSFLNKKSEWTDSATLMAHTSAISPKLYGYIDAIHVEDNQFVKKGDVLVVIDRTDYEIAYKQAQANVQALQAALKAAQSSYEITAITAPAQLESAKAKIAASQALLKKTNKDLQRIKSLSNVATEQQLDATIAQQAQDLNSYKEALAYFKTVNTIEQTLALAKANLEGLKAQLEGAKATLEQAQSHLNNTFIKAPFDGRVTKKSVELGIYVQPGQSLMAIVAQDLWVVANFKETQLTKMKPGQKAKVTIDAYPQYVFNCVVDSIQRGSGAAFSLFPAENATGNFVKIVQRVPVKLCFIDPLPADLVLGPGMSILATVYVNE